MPKRSKVDWILEVIALLATLAAIVLVAVYWQQLGLRPRFPWMRPVGLPLHTTLSAILAIDAIAYLGLTLGARGRGLFQIPEQMDREAPHVRQMLFSMVIVMKAVLSLFGLYLVWSLINIGLRRGVGLSGEFLTVFTLAVPVPLVFYTLKLRRYSK